ncbi:MAG: 3-oxoacyl-ACP synthase [Muribaculaceae bacterium]|nr:3-oxoacyl-ACP synthase [Muribaculaceae bacterium]
MATIISHNIISPLGLTSVDNYNAILAGESAIATYPGLHKDMRPYSASLIASEVYDELIIDGYSKYESLVIQSIKRSLDGIDLDVSSIDICLILSTTKGNIEELDLTESQNVSPAVTAQRIADYFGITTTPITVCNACISGVSAMLLAQRLIDTDSYKKAIVCGCDVQSEFIISGFQSLNAVSQTSCRPFDIERIGLSLGEGAATVILSQNKGDLWAIAKGAVRNDAYHNTTPSPVGEGSSLALGSLGELKSDDIAFINAHGTATMFNDQMESKAIERANLGHIPVNALKGNLGHTMGAAGIIETIISMVALDNGVILGSKGFEMKGVSGKINVLPQPQPTDKKAFVKMISGFGGCNGALLVTKGQTETNDAAAHTGLQPIHTIKITPNECILDGNKIETEGQGKALLKELYAKFIGSYPKFHKMDLLCQLGFAAIQILHSAANGNIPENSSVILFNRSSSITTDIEYLKTISDEENYFPSPALFVYTLPNIVLSEVAIKNQIKGETAFYLLPQKDEATMRQIINSTLTDNSINSLVTGWIDCYGEDDFVAEISLLQN